MSICRSVIYGQIDDTWIELESSLIQLQSAANELVSSLIVHI